MVSQRYANILVTNVTPDGQDMEHPSPGPVSLLLMRSRSGDEKFYRELSAGPFRYLRRAPCQLRRIVMGASLVLLKQFTRNCWPSPLAA